jgi:transcriptional antiterminator RfaH
MEDVEVYNPRIRFSRSTRQGPVWVTEALFPNYLFARFDWKTSLPRVHYAPGVSCVVHFGSRWPQVPDQVIADLQASLGKEDVHVIPKNFQPGDEVHISGGAFHGLNAVITKVMPGRERVMVLMDFLGRQSTVEIGVTSIVKEGLRG